ncbi:MAG: tetratricopeptide repeat protein [candidate division Zixibacteria bacterium]|nr:tetratricopeptide repeat protein [candidate division Zixibacteria bacterium]
MSREVYQKTGNILGLGESATNLGMVFEREEDWGNALKYHAESIELLERIGHSRHLWNAYINYSRVLARTGDIALAQEILQKAYAILKDVKNVRGLAEAKRVEGLIASIQGGWDRAKTFFDESERLCGEADDPLGHAQTLHERAILYIRKGDTDMAVSCFVQARAAFEKLRAMGSVRHIDRQLELLVKPYNPA